jgi:SAM-dependent methyltransferase
MSPPIDPDRPSQDLGYDDLRQLARDPALSENQKMGFGPAHRHGNEDAILADIVAKLPALRDTGRTIVDIGPGCGPLARLLTAHCAAHRHRLVLVDSPEMLALLPEQPAMIKLAGRYPGNAAAVAAAANGSADAILCYSVLHIIYVDDNPFHAVDQAIELLGPGGWALFGDIPNVSKRKRFLASAAGAAFHRRFMQTDDAPEVEFNRPEPGRIDDAVLAAMVQRAQSAGCDAYVVPQPDDLPYANRRDDLLIRKP